MLFGGTFSNLSLRNAVAARPPYVFYDCEPMRRPFRGRFAGTCARVGVTAHALRVFLHCPVGVPLAKTTATRHTAVGPRSLYAERHTSQAPSRLTSLQSDKLLFSGAL